MSEVLIPTEIETFYRLDVTSILDKDQRDIPNLNYRELIQMLKAMEEELLEDLRMIVRVYFKDAPLSTFHFQEVRLRKLARELSIYY